MSLAARPALATPLDRRDRHRHPDGDVVDALADGTDDPGELVPEHDPGNVHRGPGGRPGIGVEIAPADAVARHLDQHLTGSGVGSATASIRMSRGP